ncbi:MAG: hypothetical protein CMM46_00890 [Rhodospirillaceae bacterium]|nr:hypothetical protein [Rhodospirillaceae bacterium]|tara:strand:- start:1666 stop:2826 length:1161 start_codon:yes stop_codon:yes gene_type:complete
MTEPFLDPKPIPKPMEITEWLRGAREHHEGGTWGVVRDIMRAWRWPGRLKPYEYFMMGLYDAKRFTPEQRREFMGDRLRAMMRNKTLEREWLGVTTDKLLFLSAMKGQELPVPDVLAVYHPFRRYAQAAQLSDGAAVADWLRQGASFPFFSKPVEGTGSSGVASIEGYEPYNDCLISADGRRVPVEQFVKEIARYRERGYIFQERIVTHPDLEPVCGSGITGCRILVRMQDGEPHLHRATWKIRVITTIADNFWRSGNMLGAVDPLTGEITRVVSGISIHTKEVNEHPETGAQLVGFKLPEWEAVRETCLAAAATFPALWIQGWDISISANGPLIFEVEGDGGAAHMIQHAQGKGLLEPDHLAFLEAWEESSKARKASITSRRRKS